MPGRYIREGYLDSARIDALSADADRFYFRLLLVVDDAGRFDARASFLATSCWPIRRDKRPSDVSEWLSDCAANELLVLYEFDGRPYLQVTRWKMCGSAARSKFPWKDGKYEIEYVAVAQRHGDQKPPQFVATSMPLMNPVATPSVGGSPPNPLPLPLPLPLPSLKGGVGENYNLPVTLDTPEFRETWAKWVQHRKEINKKLTPTAVGQQWKHLAELGLQKATDAILHSISQGYTGIYEDNKKGKSNGSTTGNTRKVSEFDQVADIPIIG